MEYITLNNGIKMPVLGYGVFRIDEKECQRCVTDALEVGYRMIDTAEAYHNEKAVGNAIKASGIAREELFITTKLKCNGPDPMTEESFYRSLEKLGLDYVDLYLIHQPYGNVFGCYETMEKLQEKGLIKSIGVSNFTDPYLADIIVNHKIKPVVNQIEINPVNQKEKSVLYMKQEQVQPMAWAPLAQGGKNVFSSEILKTLARKHGKSLSQIILRWHIQRGVVAIPKSSNKERMKENLNIFDFELEEKEMKQIEGMEAGNIGDLHEDPEFVKMLCGKWKLRDYVRK